MKNIINIQIILLIIIFTFSVAWEAKSETLDDAWQRALKANRGLKSVKIQSEAAESILNVVKSSRIPRFDANAGYTMLDKEQALAANLFGQKAEVPMMPNDSFSYGFTASVPLFTGGQIKESINAANAMLDASKTQITIYEQNLKMEVAKAYVSVLRAQRMLNQAKSHVNNLEAHAYDVEGLFEQGMVIVSDKLSAQVALADARQRELLAENAVDITKAAYNKLLMQSLDNEVVLDEIDCDCEIAGKPLEELTESALNTRKELKAIDESIKTAMAQSKAVGGGKLPQIGLAGGYAYQENDYQTEEGKWFIGVQANINLFDGGGIRHKSIALKQKAFAIKEQRLDTVSLIALQVRQAWLNVNETMKRVKVTEEAIEMSEENLKVTRDRYKNGFCSHTEVLDAETLRINSQTSAANAFYDYVLASLTLLYTLGTL
ncbi:outer membrane efflux protein [Denitrovibrio acetiphilus DSM 12809]|jgi:outer membrane protein TolC|uniref:Outer membrane efflux protein n=1 Tax=Denitrovibrio acetiphilus (strain DSM 12809 / NBRC 114555 / N2460) TaxID=522772 RepID=D4H896_DENA2|nr:TolC family protein [Denitrovibrio acetiphilus]ADD68245.1 outer membrane efflux protein [Denitrovibrio acetiphilus DSM 12809]